MTPNQCRQFAPCARRAEPCVPAVAKRVCRAWHEASRVNVSMPGTRRAGGLEKVKGVTVRWGLEQAQSKAAGRPTGTGCEM